MRSKFRGHFGETKETFDELWQSATFVFDANVLLNLYRYSDSARTEFLTFLGKIRERCWLPEQCAREFLDNRTNVIKDQIKSYEDTTKAITQIRTKFEGSKAHPFISEGSFEGLNAALLAIEKELSDGEDGQIKRITQDKIKEEIANIFDGSVGDPFTDDELSKLFEEGKTRYEEKIPPGYMDGSKHKDLNTMFAQRSRYGDLIWWRQAIQKAKSDDHSLIVVTDDQKEDWWEIASGKTVGPRPELISEFCRETGQNILIYSPESFLKHAQKRLQGSLSAKTIKEVKTEHEARVVAEPKGILNNALRGIGRDEFADSLRTKNHLPLWNALADIGEATSKQSRNALRIEPNGKIPDFLKAEIARLEHEITETETEIDELETEMAQIDSPNSSNDYADLALLRSELWKHHQITFDRLKRLKSVFEPR